MRDLQGFTANSESKPSSASVTVHRVFFIFSPNITCPPHALPQHVHLSQLTSLPNSPSPQKWKETVARHQKLLGAFLYGVLTNAVQLRNGLVASWEPDSGCCVPSSTVVWLIARTVISPNKEEKDCIYPHGSPVPTTAWSQICPPRHTVGCEHAPFLPTIPSCREPTSLLRVSEWPSTYLEPTNKKNSYHSKWPWGPGCNLAEDTATGTPAPQVQILEMPSKTSVCTLKPEADARPGMPMCLGLWQTNSSLRPLLLAGYEDGSVTLWDISERKVCSQITCHEEPVMGLDFDSQKAKGISGSAGKVLAVWSLDDQQSLQVKKTHELTNPGIAEVTIRPDHKILATAGWDHRIRVFHWRTMKPLAVLAFHSAPVYCVAFAADGLLAAGSKDQRISIWSLYPCP
ncbi:guanine nucleotide-binding protein subunit beta-like protein 1 isoform X2 [Mus musculus]|uniref:guanine nucleotide-binding protein subunit beta-like protein 1 isoform X2 n=2 Tax=Mus musculus TaxID=10090 RepID=UPI0005AB93D5|nr:guanine nucleotide-binding protein subunit beta-like protein 1 isoform X2 [Mus musculus]|eukprot:XP_011244130.1 PREDICTED: guanine nucleotide-binding protein subunit beta-like protein 1 isoform X1 [Mus musculus]